MTLILLIVFVALAFEYINGFHDTANSIATVVSTKVLSPRQAVMLAAFTNLIGALWGTAVAKTIASGLIDTKMVTEQMMGPVILCALIGAIVWNLVTWYWGLPSSSSHALIGGLVGAALAVSNRWEVVIWSIPNKEAWYQGKGVLWKVLVPMIASPFAGFVLGMMIMGSLYVLLRNWKPRLVKAIFGRAQIVSAAGMGFMHGTNDAQKTMGIIALALAAGTTNGSFQLLPDWLSFLRLEQVAGKDLDIPTWIKVICALVMAAGTAAGGWRIIKTLGHKMVKLQPVHGFAAETTSATVIGLASYFGIPVSTTHNISASIMGVGAAKSFRALKWTVVEKMVWAWLFTIPVSATIGFLCVKILLATGLLV
jgi:inorganic phosphate transporter, PiT family